MSIHSALTYFNRAVLSSLPLLCIAVLMLFAGYRWSRSPHTMRRARMVAALLLCVCFALLGSNLRALTTLSFEWKQERTFTRLVFLPERNEPSTLPWHAADSCPDGVQNRVARGGHGGDWDCHVGPLVFTGASLYGFSRFRREEFVCGVGSPGIPDWYDESFLYRFHQQSNEYEYRCLVRNREEQFVSHYLRVQQQTVREQVPLAPVQQQRIEHRRTLLGALSIMSLLAALLATQYRRTRNFALLHLPWIPVQCSNEVGTCAQGTLYALRGCSDGAALVCAAPQQASKPFRELHPTERVFSGTIATLREQIEQAHTRRLLLCALCLLLSTWSALLLCSFSQLLTDFSPVS